MPKSKSKKKVRNKPKLLFQSPETRYSVLKDQIEQQNEGLEQQKKDLEHFRKNLDALSKSHANHLSLLSNFARHDLKNYTHSIDGIVSTCNADEITNEQLESIRLNIQFIRNTLDDFAKLAVHDEGSKCEFEDLVVAIRTINRTNFAETGITFEVNNNVDVTFNIPFTIMFQLLNNLIVNSIKAFEVQGNSENIIELKAYVDSKKLIIEVSDNGRKIEETDKNFLFDYGFSKTGGTGIGLYHATHLCDTLHGNIIYRDRPSSKLNKCFIITLPIAEE
ncbi:sensor histidine kinase [Psychrobacter fozii]|uniref:histidine kinase n=1 Tax=Psychrobacter fozii TaxID=198480 RepID=A0A2V4VS02_9GAMM|nr:HAMP domain-containing sensor histidine kinase [Psychrobacter fozii]PYE38094.1 signal transduction histidine kinase [Psychrobacter fozii]